MREPTFYILLSLAHTQKHGYAILKDVEKLSDGKVRLSNSTLYGALTRLQDQGLIARIDSRSPSDSGRPRKAYCLTDAGQRLLNAEVKRMQSLVNAARLRIKEEST